MPQCYKLDFKARGEMKVKSFKRQKGAKIKLKVSFFLPCVACGHQKQI